MARHCIDYIMHPIMYNVNIGQCKYTFIVSLIMINMVSVAGGTVNYTSTQKCEENNIK